jgi:hypothetical protein
MDLVGVQVTRAKHTTRGFTEEGDYHKVHEAEITGDGGVSPLASAVAQ